MDADLVATGTTTAVVTVAVDDAIPVATTVTEETAVGTGVPVAANVTTDTTEVSDTTGEGDASGAAIVAAVVMVTTGVGETVGTDWPDAAGGGIKATKRPATANTGMARRLNMRRWGWTTDGLPLGAPRPGHGIVTNCSGLGC